MKLIAAVLIAAAVLAAAPLSAHAQAPKSGGTLVIGRPTDAISLDPHKATTAPEVWVYGNIFETLVTLDEKMQVRPVLAERWERVNDRTMRFYLKKGVVFHDGTPFNAAAVKFTLDRVLDAKTPARGRSWLGPVTGATVVDDATVDVLTSAPFGPLLNHLTMVFVVGIVSPDAARKAGDDFGRAPVGTGPFRFEEWKSNQSITLARNDKYWGPRAHLDRVVFRVIPEEGARTIAYDRGDLDVLLRAAPIELERLKKDRRTQVNDTPGLRIIYLGFNTQAPPLDDARMRRALAHGIDVKGINSYVVENAMLPARSVIAPMVFGYKDTQLPEKYAYDPERAKKLLADLGWAPGPDGILRKAGKPLELTFWASEGRDLKDKEISEAVLAQLTKLGVKVTFQRMEWGAYLNALRAEKPPYNLFALGWVTMTGDGDFGLYATFHSANIPPRGTQAAHYRNPEVDKLLDEARASLDPAKRAAAYGRALEHITTDLPWLPIYQTKETVVLRSHVKGYVGHPAEYYLRLGSVWLDK
ncbi:MAG: ABC transporter substrate-binding protein [Candidatus Rokuibacteriota bacterium]